MSEDKVEAVERIDPLQLFPEQHQERVRGLAYLGFIEKSIDFCGHTFGMKTLRPAEKAAIAILVDPWKGTLAEPEVWANGHVGLSLTSIDGNTEFCNAVGPNINDYAQARFKYITNPETGLYQPTLDFLFGFYLQLEGESLEAVKEFQNLAERSQQPSQPSADSSIGQGISLSEINLDALPSEPSK